MDNRSKEHSRVAFPLLGSGRVMGLACRGRCQSDGAVRWRNSQQDRCQNCVCAWLLLDLCFWVSRLFLKRSDLASLAQSYVNLNVAATKINNDYTTESCCSNKNTPKEPGWQIMKSKHLFEKHNETFTSPLLASLQTVYTPPPPHSLALQYYLVQQTDVSLSNKTCITSPNGAEVFSSKRSLVYVHDKWCNVSWN